MAEVRCPMCGKANPAELDECKYCQARLRPFWDTVSKSNPSSSSDDQASDLPEWLRSLRRPADQADLPFPPERDAQSALPDWLSQLREQPDMAESSQEDETSDDLAGGSDDSPSSWLQDILSEGGIADEADQPDQAYSSFQQDEAGWISRIGSTPIEEERPPKSSGKLDWLSESEQPASDTSSRGGGKWATQPASPPIEPDEPLPDWLTQTGAGTPVWPGQDAALAGSETGISPEDDLSEIPAGEEDLPAWLQPAKASTSDAGEPAEASGSDWTKLRPEDSSELQWVDDEALNWLDEEDDDLPAWLFDKTSIGEPAEPAKSIPADQEAQPVDVTSTDQLVPEEEGISPDQVEPSIEAQGEGSTVPEVEVSALAGMPFEEPVPEEQAPASGPAETEVHEEDEALTLAGAAIAATGLEAVLNTDEEPVLEEQPPASGPAETEAHEEHGEDEAPMLAGAAIAAAGLEAVLNIDQDKDELGWLGELEDTFGDLSLNAPDEHAQALDGAEGLGQGPGSTLPVWLTQAAAEEQALAESAEEQAELKPAELPSWLQAMRPVGLIAAGASLAGEHEQLQIEGAGPLAGLRGALPAEPDVSHVQKPPVYSLKLQVSDTQQLQAELLRGLIEREGQPQALTGRPVISSQDFIRLLIAVLLIFPLLFVVLTGSPQFDLPAPSVELDAVGKLIDALPAGAPVLLSVDYQPGFSGEMDAVATPVVQHLFERGAYLALVSTLSTGPAQAEHLLSQVRSTSSAPLQELASSTNLGYIPGGATGLLAFAQSPQDTLPTNTRGERAWDASGLQGIDTLDKFSLVIVATENPDIARYWIEQVQPQLGATPLLMLLSAQAEPMVWPYYHASPSQVQGLVGGLAGAAAYEVRSVQGGAATQFWSPYSAGVWIAALLMVLGGILYLILAQSARQKEEAGGEKRP